MTCSGKWGSYSGYDPYRRSQGKHYMSFLHKDQKKLEDTLRSAYHRRENVAVNTGGQWQMDVMCDIRRLGPLNAQNNPLVIFNQFVWRFATVACMIVLFLSVYTGVTGFNPTDDIADMFLGDPVEFTLVQDFGDY